MQIGQDVITDNDVEDFAKIITLTHQKHFETLLPEEKERVRNHSLGELKRIMVQLKVAKDFTPSEKELKKTLESLAKQNHSTFDEMKKNFKNSNINWDMFVEKIKAQVAWERYIRNRFAPLIISKEDKMSIAKEMEYEVVELNFKSENDALSCYKKISSLKTFSEKRVAVTGYNHSNLGWIPQSFLSNKITVLSVGECTPPFYSNKIYKVLFLRDRKEPEHTPESQTTGDIEIFTLPKAKPGDLEYDFLKKQFYANHHFEKRKEIAKKMGGHLEILNNTSFFELNLPFEKIKEMLNAPENTKFVFNDQIKNIPVEYVIRILRKNKAPKIKALKMNWGDVRLNQLAEKELAKHMKIMSADQ